LSYITKPTYLRFLLKTPVIFTISQLCKTAISKSSAITKRPARRSVSVKMLSYSSMNNANRSRVSLKSTFSNCHVLFEYLHSFVQCIVAVSSTIAQWACDAPCHIHVMLKWAMHVIIRLTLQPTLLMSTGP